MDRQTGEEGAVVLIASLMTTTLMTPTAPGNDERNIALPESSTVRMGLERVNRPR